jgi:hypothetical protein
MPGVDRSQQPKGVRTYNLFRVLACDVTDRAGFARSRANQLEKVPRLLITTQLLAREEVSSRDIARREASRAARQSAACELLAVGPLEGVAFQGVAFGGVAFG